jgi:DNA-binding NarL/FixJ family response regulator
MIQVSRRASVVIALKKSELLDAKDLVAMADGWMFLDENTRLAPEIAWLSKMQYCIVPHFMKPQFALDQLRVDLIDDLSLREHSLLRELARGRSNREIAERLALTESAVSSQIRALLMKLGFQNRTEAAVFAAKFTTYLRGSPPQPPSPPSRRD